MTPKDFHVNGKGSGKEAEMTAGHNSYIASAAADPGPGGSTDAFSSLTTTRLSLLFALDFHKWLQLRAYKDGHSTNAGHTVAMTEQMQDIGVWRKACDECHLSAVIQSLYITKKQRKSQFHNYSDLVILIAATFLFK